VALHGERMDKPTYTCLQTIGEGNVGICRRGTHDIYGKEIVQKTISLLGVPDGIAHEPRLLQEANHEFIVEVWEAQWDPDPDMKAIQAVTFVSPYYPGGSVLTALIENHCFGVRDVLITAQRILDALAYLHQTKGYLHRDVKPGNILLDEGRTGGCLADLGSAARMDEDGRTDNREGTRLYLDPHAVVTGHMTVRSDLFALGSTLTEMLRGRWPYENITDKDIDARLAAGQRPLPDSQYLLPPHVPDAVRRLVRALTHADPSKRPESAEAALRKVNALRVVDWKRMSGTGLSGTWEGSWPPDQQAHKRHTYRIAAVEVVSGGNQGTTCVTVHQRRPGGKWRAIRALCAQIPANDARALGKCFRSVEKAVAQ
jgi:serine/threonine protein kinase